MFERRVKCTKCSQYTELIINESETRHLQGWTCRQCGYVNRLNVAGEIACVASDPIDVPGPPPPPATPPSDPPGPPGNERRQHARVKLTASPLLGRRISGGDTFVVEEASSTGFSMVSRSKFTPGTSYQFRMWSSQHSVAIVAAVCRSCTLVESEPWLHRVGFQFLPQSGRRLRIILTAIEMNTP